MIIFFRGKAATGKTYISTILGEKLNIPIVEKDDFLDIFLEKRMNVAMSNEMSYDILALVIQKHIDMDKNLIVDIGLAHTPYFEIFLGKFICDSDNIRSFLFQCSDNDIWERRIAARIDSDVPNQYFKSVDDAVKYYDKYDICLRDGESLIDSSMSSEIILEEICEKINC
jgi:cytidylate kinase